MEGQAMRAIYALCPDADSAQQAVDGLRAAGVLERDIAIISSEPIEEYEFAQRDKATWLYYIAAGGGVLGLCFATWLTRMTETAWPIETGGMPIVSWWPNMIVMFELTMLGGILATVITLFITAKLPGRSTLYDPAVADGKILVGVEHPGAGAVPALERALGADPTVIVKRLKIQGRTCAPIPTIRPPSAGGSSRSASSATAARGATCCGSGRMTACT